MKKQRSVGGSTDLHGRALAVVRRAGEGSTEACAAAVEEVAAGQYWRPLNKLRKSATTRAQHPAIPAGTVLLVVEVENADGVMHSIHLAPHPTWCETARSHVHVEDFLTQWERAWDADKIREAELLALGREMQDTQAAMLSGPPAAGRAAELLQHEPTANEGGCGQELATAEGLQAMAARAGALREQAESQAKWIKEHSEILGAQGLTLARFHEERGQAMLARAKNQLQGVGKVLELVKNLRLYTGEGVGVDLVRDGEPAAPDEPVTIYQDLLALDEETGALLDQGGMDHRHTAELSKQLDDEALRSRLIPASRGLVLCQFRRLDKEFVRPAPGASLSDALGAMLANGAMNDEAQRVQVLYRDGERFWLISHADLFKGMTQLMPSTAEQNEQFIRKGRWWNDPSNGERITPEDLDYAAAQRDQLGTLTSYARVLIVLWGLRDRTGLFDSTSIPQYGNWLDPRFQSTHLRLVSQDLMLGEERESYAAFRQRHNAYLARGSLVAVHAEKLFDSESAPGCFGPEYYDQLLRRDTCNQFYRDVGPDVVVQRVRFAQGRPFIEIQARYMGYRTVERDVITTKLWLTDMQHVLVLDRLHGADLDYYLGSRRQRRAYADYLALFRVAREHVSERDRGEAGLRRALSKAVADAGIAHDENALPGQITEAIAAVRVASKGALSDDPVVLRRALDALHAVLASGQGRADAAAALARTLGREPLRLVHTGKGVWRLYLSALNADRDPRLVAHPWCMVGEVGFGEAGAVLSASLQPDVVRAVTGEQVIHDWPGVEVTREVPAMSWAKTQDVLGRVEGFSRSLLDKGAIAAEAYAIAVRAMDKSRRMVERVDAAFAVGTAIRHRIEVSRSPDDAGVRATSSEPRILVLGGDALDLAYHWGDDALKDQCRAAIRRFYAQADSNIARLEDWPFGVRLDLMDLAAYAAQGKVAVFSPGILRQLPDRMCWGRPDAVTRALVVDQRIGTCVQVTTLNEAGAVYCPELVEHCEAPSW